MRLGQQLLVALSNLETKSLGASVDWINIADATALTQLGLAERCRSGWKITEAGKAISRARGNAGRTMSGRNVVSLFPMAQ